MTIPTEGAFALGSVDITTPSYTDTAASVISYQATVLNALASAMMTQNWTAQGWIDGGTNTTWTGSTIPATYRSFTRTGGATLFIGIFGPWSNGAAYNITTHSVNAGNLAFPSSSLSVFSPHIMIAYSPPGVTMTIGTGNPFSNASWFTNARSFRWMNLGSESSMTASLGTPIQFRWGVQGDTFWLTRKYSSTSAGSFAASIICGEIINCAEATDTADTAKYGAVTFGLQGIGNTSAAATSYVESQFYAVDGTRRTGYITFPSPSVTSSLATQPPWMRKPYEIFSTSPDAVRVGSSFKGIINPAIASAVSSACPVRRRLAGGAYTHLASGVVFGYLTGAAELA